MERESECPCKEPGWCEKYQMQLVGRPFDICRGYDDNGKSVLTLVRRNKYRILWEEMVRSEETVEVLSEGLGDEEKIEISQESTGQKHELPDIITLGRNFAKALAKHIVKPGNVSKEEYEHRLKTCEGCEFLLKKKRRHPRCAHKGCGCFLAKKAVWKSESCPIGKW
jgi:hypothetical protein